MGEPIFDRELIVIVDEPVQRTRDVNVNVVFGIGAAAMFAGVVLFAVVGAWSVMLLGFGLICVRLGSSPRGGHKRPAITRHARVAVSKDGIMIDDSEFIRRDDIAQAYFQPRLDSAGSVRCLGPSGRVVLDTSVQSEDEANELLQALGKDVTHGRAKFDLASPLLGAGSGWQAMLGALALIAAATVMHAEIVLGPLFIGAILLLVAAAFGQSLEVGVDGLSFQWFGTSRFVGYDKIASVTKAGSVVTVTLANGRKIPLSPRAPSQTVEQTALELALKREALFARIEAARAAFARRVDAADVALRVGRGGRPVAAWRAELTRLGDVEEGGYRDAATRKEDLWRLVEDAGAPPDARAGAAIALRKDDGASSRLRVAAEAVASPKLRIALEKAADPAAEEEILDEVLQALERE